MTRTFTYRFEDGTECEMVSMPKSLMDDLEKRHGKCTYNGWAEFMGVGQPSRLGIIGGSNTKGDGFKTGWNPALGMEIRSPEHHKRVLKEKGLVEIGNERPRDAAPKKRGLTDEIIKDAVDHGAELSGREIEALKAGEKIHEQ